jgi:hypothetical protein
MVETNSTEQGVAKSDFRSKRTMGYLLVLLALADTGRRKTFR